jgi:hypothetical protein
MRPLARATGREVCRCDPGALVDGTAVGGCSFMIHVRHDAAAIAAGPLQDRIDHAWRERALRAERTCNVAQNLLLVPAKSRLTTG